MHITKNSKSQGLPGQAFTVSKWPYDVSRIQASWGEVECATGAHPSSASGHGVPSGDGDDGGGLPGVHEQAIKDAFIAKPWVPHAYQTRGVEWLHQTEAALFLPPGLGKTSIGLATIVSLKAARLPCRTLILAPLMVCRTTWMTEPRKWSQFQGLKIGFAHGPNKLVVLKDKQYDIVVLNYDGIEWAAAELAKGHSFDILLCDEITRLKNTNTKRYKLFKPVAPSFKIRWGFTGTPAANGLMDLFGQVYVLDLGKRFGRYITHFRAAYFHQLPWDSYRYYITPSRSKMLTAKLADLAMYIDPEEWLQLPDFITIPLQVELGAQAYKGYKSLEHDFIVKFEEGVVTVANAGVLTSKLRQYTGGAIYESEGVWHDVDKAKLEKLDELVDEMAGEPLMVAYQFDHEMQRIKARHKDALVLKGGMTALQVTKVIDEWNLGNCHLLLVQPASAALGLNLQFGGAAICWFTLTYNLEEFIQMNKRLHRQGQVQNVKCYLMIANKTIDQVVSDVLVSKNVAQQDLFEALRTKLGK